MAPQPSVKAKSKKAEKHSCKWWKCEGSPHKEPIKIGEDYPNNGNTNRDKCENWRQPFDFVVNSYTKFGVKKGEFRGLKSTKYGVKWGTSIASNYTTQPHHVIPVDAMNSYKKLSHNLVLLGWNINDEISNGICLPYFKEDQIWHCLQPHRGSHPKNYTTYIKQTLARLQAKSKNYCVESEKENSKINQWTLLDDINELVKEVRNGILNWTIMVHRLETLDKWTKQVEKRSIGRKQGYYKDGAGGTQSSLPIYKRPPYSGRKYPK